MDRWQMVAAAESRIRSAHDYSIILACIGLQWRQKEMSIVVCSQIFLGRITSNKNLM
jgi:hypothetical protein